VLGDRREKGCERWGNERQGVDVLEEIEGRVLDGEPLDLGPARLTEDGGREETGAEEGRLDRRTREETPCRRKKPNAASLASDRRWVTPRASAAASIAAMSELAAPCPAAAGSP
jgi:hypothetical protein